MKFEGFCQRNNALRCSGSLECPSPNFLFLLLSISLLSSKHLFSDIPGFLVCPPPLLPFFPEDCRSSAGQETLLATNYACAERLPCSSPPFSSQSSLITRATRSHSGTLASLQPLQREKASTKAIIWAENPEKAKRRMF